MSVAYKTVQWSPYKRRYDASIAVGVFLFLGVFFTISKLTLRGVHAISDEILLARALGAAAIVLLHLILCIGPLCRLNRRFLPLLYNRRHLGVTMFFLALLHGLLGLGFYHGFGNVWPLHSLLISNTQYRSISAFPFESPGVIALLILFLMAATSHDFWLKNLSPSIWKSLHMLVYVAYVLVIMHVALGVLQAERSPVYAGLLGLGVVLVTGLHLIAGIRERNRGIKPTLPDGWIDACGVGDIVPDRGKVISIAGQERVAIFRHGQGLSALSNVCAHQGGPLGEGRIIGGCVTCPWHGYQYQPHDGCAPAPFTEKLPTYRLRIENGRVWLQVEPLPPGTAVEPVVIKEAAHV